MLDIGPETQADVESVARLHVNAWRAGYAGILPADLLDGLDPEQWVAVRRLRFAARPDGPAHTLVARDGEHQITGFVTLGPYRLGHDGDADLLDHRYGEIRSCYVDPDRWGTGIGRSLVAAAVAALARHRMREVRLWVFAGNARARRFYEHRGLRADGNQRAYPLSRFGRPDLRPTELRYALRLRSD